MSDNNYDIVIIGGGPAGYIAAIRSAQMGFKTACVEKRKALGGTCLNIGCIPSKALLDSSEHFAFLKSKISKHGVKVSGVELDLPTMMKRKDQVVTGLTGGIAGIFKRRNILYALGAGKILSPTQVEVTGEGGSTSTLNTKIIILATGSEVTPLPAAPVDGKSIITSTEALALPKVPETMLVIGAGAIGLEMGSVWSRLGTKVTVVEYLERVAPFADKQMSAELQKVLTRQGIEFKLSTKVVGTKVSGGKVTVEMEPSAGGAKETMTVENVLVSIGRRPYTEGLGLETVGIKKDKAGRVEVDAQYRTSVSNIYAIGDIIKGPMLAHKAEDEGVAVVELIAGQHGHVNYDAIPNVIYTWPELATVGATEEECKSKGIEVKVGTFPFMANGRAKAMDEAEGLVKVIADAKSDRLLGVHIVGPRASDMIAEAVAVMEFGGAAEDIARSTHAHPTLSEALKEAALNVDKRALNF